uniref:Uncharacterized protein n=1 Tax=Oryza meridionalis TaxID=40149 RepID=A0A0E0EDI0_9ORYZ
MSGVPRRTRLTSTIHSSRVPRLQRLHSDEDDEAVPEWEERGLRGGGGGGGGGGARLYRAWTLVAALRRGRRGSARTRTPAAATLGRDVP